MLVRIRVALDCSLPAERVLLALRGEPWPFALTGRWAGGGAIVGCAPARAARRRARTRSRRLEDLPAPRGDAEVGGGWFGWLGYGLGARVEALPPRPPRPFPLPDAHLAFYDHVLRQDDEGQWWFEALDDGDTPSAAAAPARAPARAARRRARARAAGARDVLAARARRGRARGRGGGLRRADRRRRDLPGQPLPAARRELGRRRRRALRARRAAARSPPTARASSRPGAASRASRPSSSCAAAAAHVTTGPIKGTAPERPGGAARLREGPRRARDDRRPHAQRPRARRRVRHRPRAGGARGPAARRRLAPRLRGRAPSSPRATATPRCCARPSRPARSPARPRSRRCT